MEADIKKIENAMAIWSVYYNSEDYPDQYVARRWLVTDAGSLPTSDMFVANDLGELRALLPRGLLWLPRRKDDDPVIVETWL